MKEKINKDQLKKRMIIKKRRNLKINNLKNQEPKNNLQQIL